MVRDYPLIAYKDLFGNDVFRIEKSGEVYIKGLRFADGSSTQSAGGVSPTPFDIDGGSF